MPGSKEFKEKCAIIIANFGKNARDSKNPQDKYLALRKACADIAQAYNACFERDSIKHDHFNETDTTEIIESVMRSADSLHTVVDDTQYKLFLAGRIKINSQKVLGNLKTSLEDLYKTALNYATFSEEESESLKGMLGILTVSVRLASSGAGPEAEATPRDDSKLTEEDRNRKFEREVVQTIIIFRGKGIKSSQDKFLALLEATQGIGEAYQNCFTGSKKHTRFNEAAEWVKMAKAWRASASNPRGINFETYFDDFLNISTRANFNAADGLLKQNLASLFKAAQEYSISHPAPAPQRPGPLSSGTRSGASEAKFSGGGQSIAAVAVSCGLGGGVIPSVASAAPSRGSAAPSAVLPSSSASDGGKSGVELQSFSEPPKQNYSRV